MSFRILLASDFYPPFIGGAERQVQLLSRELVQRGHDINVATVWHKGLPEIQVDSRIIIYRLRALMTQLSYFSKDSSRRFHPPFPDPLLVWKLHQLIARFRPDVVHASGWIAYSCALAVLGMRVPLVVSARDYGYSCATRSLLYQDRICDGPAPFKCMKCASGRYGLPKALAAVTGVLGNRALLTRRVAAIHCDTNFVQKIVKRDLLRVPGNIARTKLWIIPGALEEPADELSTSESSALVPREPYILFVGALQANKGLSVLLAAYRRLASPPPLVLIGSTWPSTPKQFPDGIVVLKNVSHSDVMDAWKNCLFGVAPSIWPEPFGLVIIEAMSRGKAVIGTAVGGIVDIITDGTTGLLIPPGDVPALTNAMQKLIDNPDLREQLGKAGQEDVKRFTADSIVVQFENLYAEMIDETRR